MLLRHRPSLLVRSGQCLPRAGCGRMDITFGAATAGCGSRDDGRGHLIRDMSGGNPFTNLTAMATACIKDTGCAADALNLSDTGSDLETLHFHKAVAPKCATTVFA